MFIEVRVGALPGRVETIAIPEDNPTVAQALQGYADTVGKPVSTYDNYEITVNREKVDGDHELQNGEMVMIKQKVSGN